MATAPLSAGLRVTIATHGGGANPLATASLWAGLRVTMTTLRWAEPSHTVTVSLWAGLKVTMATLRWAEPILWQQHPCGQG